MSGFVVLPNAQGDSEVIRYDVFVAGLFKQSDLISMKLHSVLGVCGEAGELADCIKKETIYGKPLDRANLIEELGDLKFYIQAVQNLYNLTEQDILQANANKLAARYKGLTYSDAAAIAREDKNDPAAS